MYTTVIIEDDPMITRLNRRYIEQDSRFAVVQTFSAAHPALFWLQRNPIDLIILDVYMPQMSGTELLLQLRAEGVDADVIMVTSANDAKTVNDAVRLGAVDYLVKPFAYERFRQALDVFSIYVLTGGSREEDATVDGRFAFYRAEGVVYAAKLEANAAEFGITENQLINNFHLIQQDWKTGET